MKKKRTCTTLSILLLTLALLLSSCQGAAEPEESVSTTPSVTASRMMFDKELWEITRESDVLEIEIQPPYQYQEYTLEDFVLYGVKEIEELKSYKRNGHTIRQFYLRFAEEKSIEELKEIQEVLAQRKDIYSVRAEEYLDKDLGLIDRAWDVLEIGIQPSYQCKEYTLEDFELYGVVKIEEITSFERNGHVIKCFRLHFPEKKSIEELKEIQEALAQRKDIYSVQLTHGYWLDAVPDD